MLHQIRHIYIHICISTSHHPIYVLHQIRHIVGASLAVVNGLVPRDVLSIALGTTNLVLSNLVLAGSDLRDVLSIALGTPR